MAKTNVWTLSSVVFFFLFFFVLFFFQISTITFFLHIVFCLLTLYFLSYQLSTICIKNDIYIPGPFRRFQSLVSATSLSPTSGKPLAVCSCPLNCSSSCSCIFQHETPNTDSMPPVPSTLSNYHLPFLFSVPFMSSFVSVFRTTFTKFLPIFLKFFALMYPIL